MSWRPSATLEALRLRAALLDAVRDYFREQGVLEIETPALGPGNVPDPEVSGLMLKDCGPEAGEGVGPHLQTSPELFMKRFVAAEGVSCFQLCKAFRLGERGRRHNPEFTLLEWYRIGFTTSALIDEVIALISACARALHRSKLEWSSETSIVRTTYRSLFKEHLDVDPVTASTAQLARLAQRHGAPDVERLGALSFLLSQVIEPSFASDQITVINRFPADQAALARIVTDDDGEAVADRFEIFLGNIELANGYGELIDSAQQSKRFEQDTESRRQRGLPTAGSQQQLIAALEHGMPSCSGVALGIDRLLMALLGLDDLSSVVAFR